MPKPRFIFPEKTEGPPDPAAFGKERVEVEKSRQFTGLDAFEKLAASDVDVILMATPPGYRPSMLRKCIEAGKHVFAKKPMAIDMAGIHHLMETAKIADEKKLAIQHGSAGATGQPGRFRQGSQWSSAGPSFVEQTGGTVRCSRQTQQPEGWRRWQLRNWINLRASGASS